MLEAMQREGADVPALKSRPAIEGLEWIWEGFWWLGTCRSIGMGAGPIPWTAVDRYSEVEQFNAFERRIFMAAIRSMDSVYLTHESDKRKKTTQPKPAAPPSVGKSKR